MRCPQQKAICTKVILLKIFCFSFIILSMYAGEANFQQSFLKGLKLMQIHLRFRSVYDYILSIFKKKKKCLHGLPGQSSGILLISQPANGALFSENCRYSANIQLLNEFKSSLKNHQMLFKLSKKYNNTIRLRIWYTFLSPSKKQMSGADSVFSKSSILH